MNWRDIPPLSALRAFEAAARAGSFSAAGRELNVTHAAVAQQVRALESHLGLVLAYREGRGVALTPEGETLAAALTDGFGGIGAAIGTLLSGQQDRPLCLSITPSFARRWLMPRLGEFWQQHPDIPLSLHPDTRVIDLRRDCVDLAIRFGAGDWPSVVSEMLLPSNYVVVGTPDLVGPDRPLTVDQMAAHRWVIEDDWPEQIRWLRSLGLDPETLRAARFPTSDLALEATRQGYGLHVESRALIDTDLSSGLLVEACTVDSQGLGYHLVTRPGPVKPALRSLIRWLKSASNN